MTFKPDNVPSRNTSEHTDFIQCSSVPVPSRNTRHVTHCFDCVFQSSECSSLKGVANVEHDAFPFGDGRRV